MNPEEIKKLLSEQMKLLAERSKEKDCSIEELCDLSRTMRELAAAITPKKFFCSEDQESAESVMSQALAQSLSGLRPLGLRSASGGVHPPTAAQPHPEVD